MARALLIAEKPALMRDIVSVYRTMNYPDQLDFEAFVGHSLTLWAPEDYYPEWSDRKNPDLLPMIPKKFNYKPSMKDVFEKVKKRLEEGNYDYLINACDAEREGQHIFHSFYESVGCTLPVKRLWIHDVTVEGIQNGLLNLRDDLNEPSLRNMTIASKLRANFDWLIGMNFSRAFSIASGGANVPVGRVMTPVLKIIVDRELELRDFKPKDFWEIEADFNGYTGIYYNPEDDNETRFFVKEKAEQLATIINGKTGVIEALDKKKSTKYAPKLHALSDLQAEANKVYGYTLAETLEIVQSLYDSKILSYPRTDSPYITQAIAKSFPKLLKALEGIPSVSPYVGQILANPDLIQSKMQDKKYVDDKKVSDHYAITPTGATFDFQKLTKKQQQILELVAKRLVAIFLPPIVQTKTTVVTVVEGHFFKTNGSMLENRGYSVLYGTKFDDTELPLLNLKESRLVKQSNLLTKQTSAPSRFTDETILNVMKNAGRFLDDDELKDVLKSSEGLGTEATRAGILEKLVTRKMIERRKKSICATDYGVSLILGIGDHRVVSPELTGIWEGKLMKIEEGELDPAQYYREMIEYIQQATAEIKQRKISVQRTSNLKTVGVCPVCGKTVLASNDYYLCQGYKPANVRTEQDCSFIVGKKSAGATLTESDVKNILSGKESKEKTATFDGVKKKGFFYFDTHTSRVRFRGSNQKRFDPTAPRPQIKTLGACPVCGKSLIAHENYFFCEDYKKNCQFIVGRLTYGATVTDDDMLIILNGGKTEDKDFTFQNGKKGTGALYFDTQTKSVRIAFPERIETVLGACPKCKGRVLEGNFYRCEHYKNSCDFLLSKKICQASITAEDVRLLLSGQETPPKAMIFNSGKAGTASLYLEGSNLKFKFL